jgi:hypothetical protein
MAGSHTPTSERHTLVDSSPLTLLSTVDRRLPDRLAGRVDGHLAAFAEHMREGLLAASTAVGLEVMADLMELEVTELAGPKGKHDPERTRTRHGTEPGSVTLGGRRVAVRRPRVRTIAGDGEPDREVRHSGCGWRRIRRTRRSPLVEGMDAVAPTVIVDAPISGCANHLPVLAGMGCADTG